MQRWPEERSILRKILCLPLTGNDGEDGTSETMGAACEDHCTQRLRNDQPPLEGGDEVVAEAVENGTERSGHGQEGYRPYEPRAQGVGIRPWRPTVRPSAVATS